ncbi:phytoene/squalene synthase family protein [Fluviicola chungangensis]|uniref:Phytoene/squalene synthase family protein n=1 Tax=Fluviicola chungangensis TaxID=2597671 RepID=A0A556MP26_9FLAO|nr:phytoene/squalene synthase family protein [Fluviicola chungangensis]TSJ41582.1 phytoene/squalene synthase family protein [Fluviicola chungangensis]
MKQLFDTLSLEISAMTTKRYSTSFSLGIHFLSKDLQAPIHAIYGFVRFADEIVDTFHEYEKEELLREFKHETYKALERGISLNPILNSFQWAVNTYKIDPELIEIFLQSMEMDLETTQYERNVYEQYILGSAEVVGLMCLKVFVRGDHQMYLKLKDSAMKLGSAFQKINFLRDLNADYFQLGRTYFPEMNFDLFDQSMKTKIEHEIELDFKAGYEGIKKLPKDARFGVYMAYRYYIKLFHKIQKTDAHIILGQRIRIPDNKKVRLLFTSYLRHNLNLL